MINLHNSRPRGVVPATLSLLLIVVAGLAAQDQGGDLNDLLDLNVPFSADPFEEAMRSFSEPVARPGTAELAEAFTLYQSEHYEQALVKAEEALRREPNSAPAYELIGVIRIKLGEVDEGIQAFVKASELMPESAGPVLKMANAYLVKNDYSAAREYFELALILQPGLPEAHWGLGILSEDQDQIVAAISHYEEALQGRPPGQGGIKVRLARLYNLRHEFAKTIALIADDVEMGALDYAAFEVLGVAYLGRDRPADAIRIFEAIPTAPPTVTVAMGLGMAYRQTGRLAESQRALRAATEQQPEFAPAWVQLAETLVAMEDHTSALAALEKARSMVSEPLAIEVRMADLHVLTQEYGKAIALLQPRAADPEPELGVLERLGLIYQRDNQPDAAETILQQASERFPGHPLPPYRLGLLCDSLGRYADAVAHFERAVTLDPENTLLQRSLSLAFTKTGQMDRAIEVATRIAEREPDAAEPRIFLATLYTRTGADDRAGPLYREVLQAHPDHVIALNNLAMIQARAGEFDEAIRLARQAVDRVPRSGQLRDTLGWIHYLQGDLSAAEVALEEASRLSPENPSILHHLGMVYVKQDQGAAALQCFERAVALSDSFPEYEATRELITGLRQIPGQ